MFEAVTGLISRIIRDRRALHYERSRHPSRTWRRRAESPARTRGCHQTDIDANPRSPTSSCTRWVPAALLTTTIVAAAAAPANAQLDTGHELTDRMAARFAVPLPSEAVTVSFDGCPGGAGGCASPDTGEIWLGGTERFVLAHEIGHVYDYRHLDGYWRGRLILLMGFEPTDHWDGKAGDGIATGDQCLVRACPAEIFADAYAACALRLDPRPRPLLNRRGRLIGTISGNWYSAYDWQPGYRRHLKVCRVIRASGGITDRYRLPKPKPEQLGQRRRGGRVTGSFTN